MAALVLALAQQAHAGDVFEPSVALSVDGAYDSNIYNGRGPDFVTKITPHLDLRVRDRQLALDAAYDFSFWDYADGKARNSYNHRFALAADEQVTRRLALRIADELVRAEDPGFLVRAGVVAPQTAILDNFADAGAAYRFTRRIEGAIGYSFHHTSFEQPPPPAEPLHDGDEHDGEAALTFRATRLDTLRLSDRGQLLLVDGYKVAATEGPALGWRRQILRTLDFRVDAGPLWYFPLGAAAAQDADTKLTWRGAAVLRWMKRPWRFVLSAVRDLISGTGAGTVLWADFLTAEVRWQPDRIVSLRAGASAFANGDAPDGPTRYDGVATDLAADFRIIDEVRVGGYYSFRWQETRGGADVFPQVTRHIVGVRLTLVLGAEAAPPHREVHHP